MKGTSAPCSSGLTNPTTGGVSASYAGATVGGDQNQRRLLVDRVPREAGDLLPDDRSHRPAHEAEIHHAQADGHAVQPGVAGTDGVERAGLLHGGLHAVGVVLEFEGIGGFQRREQLVPRPFVHQQVDVFLRADTAMVATIGAHVERANEAFTDIDVPALITLLPGVCRDLELDTLGGARLTFLFEPGHSSHIVTKRTICDRKCTDASPDELSYCPSSA